MYSPHEIYLVAREVMRSNSEVPAQKVEQLITFQRQRQPGNDWLEWAINILAPIEEMRAIDRNAIGCLWDQPDAVKKSSMLRHHCMRAVDTWWEKVSDELRVTGEFIAREVM